MIRATTKTNKVRFVCQQCGYVSPKWLGKCPDCGEWNSFVEERVTEATPASSPEREITPLPITHINILHLPRINTHLEELDRVLGGGIVPGAVILIGGPPGIGKSTLTLQVLFNLAQQGLKVLYVSGEESATQIKIRAERLKANSDELYVLTENEIENVFQAIEQTEAKVVVVDSIQTMFTSTLSSAPGSVSQVREVTALLVRLAKTANVAMFVIGHVTKEGAIAGPRMLEHMVDTVLYFEGEKGHPYRILRAVKNRFGSTNEIGVFEMGNAGLKEVKNPSEFFLSERPLNVPGSVVVPVLEGTRPILVELQALVSPSFLAMPRRTSIGIDPYRLNLLVAILEKRVGLNLGTQDIFFNVAGGVKIDEPAADLGIVTAIASSLLNKAIAPEWVFLGEVGLTGEVRAVVQSEIRLIEAQKMGFKKCILPQGNLKNLKTQPLKAIGVTKLEEAFEMLLQ
ncbi:MAG: DNA repair protein RadA [Candidatus Desulfofervidaceae bacterium]|nr:DNA repair protein RadA [Candidatus Desulfofervidaceae bacterium]